MRSLFRVQTVLPVVLFLFAFFPVLGDLLYGFWQNPQYDHAPFVVAGSAFLILKDRRHLAALRETAALPWLVVFGLLLHLLGQLAGVYYLSQIALPVTLFGIIRYLGGPGMTHRLAFPVFFLFLAFPIPGKLYYTAVFPLKLFVTQAASGLLNLLGYPAFHQGNIIHIGTAVIGVVDACSGLNSLMAGLTLALFYGRMTLTRYEQRLVLVGAVFPLVVAANVIRVVFAGIAAAHGNTVNFNANLHTAGGVVLFSLVMLALVGLARTLAGVEKRGAHA